MEFAVFIVFCVCLVPLVVLGLYPLVAFLGMIFTRRKVKQDGEVQPVTIIIACKDEERYIRRKIDSLLHPGEWIPGSELIVVSNGSTDGTNSILREYINHPGVRVVIWEHNASKIISVNHAVEIAKNDILVFSDCRQQMKTGSIPALVRNFSDPSVGTVNSTLSNSESGNYFTLRSLLNRIAQWESRSGTAMNVFGALYAQRKSLFRPFPTDLLFDDLFVIVSTLLQGKRIVTEPEAVIYDVDFERYYGANRIQRLARGLLIFRTNHHAMIRQLSFNHYWRFITFKYLKLWMPFFLYSALACALYLTYAYELKAEMLLALGILCALCVYTPMRVAVTHFFSINWNFLLAVVKFYWKNDRSNKWDKLEVVKR